ncbi:type II toxin-antitoxin system VapC family toxin [Deinococcus radiophilus]|uniref:Type II toxin-antitoxin system VapC family toxin n=1 Tax=Deinococcus radiophilus TaxID=32062 RepID=A0A3S0KXQ3_9DEIO|nr:type II toxin-antitoxin system VapC family toxin [Deinococcus radiophilus]RTR19238.1 type II toxin-antitoxin system VapC family toxin [Deinococcus radiophilus]UFA51720.1 type II toxin-antitoxin system VapC family toxin [Deinococcus radiophilus]
MYLLDTNVISELRKVKSGRANEGVVAWSQTVTTAELYLSVITVQELELGVLLKERRDLQQGAVLRKWLDGQVLPAFAGRILPITLEIARRTANLNVPQQRAFYDSLIAATALEHGYTLVTRNEADMQGTGVEIVNPFQS